MDPTALPALLGDGRGRYRVQIVGNSGSGKSTLGSKLATLLQVPFVPLDTLWWQPGWLEAPESEFRAKVRAVMDANERGWVIDGNYSNKLGHAVGEAATDIIWLDPPLALYFPRLCWRTLLRLLGLRPPCSSGCPESIRECFFSRESILLWCLTHHRPVRKRYLEKMRESRVGAPGGKMRRLGGWGGEFTRWRADVVAMVDRSNRAI